MASPIAHDRRSSDTSRANAAITIVNDPPGEAEADEHAAGERQLAPLVLAAMSAMPAA